MKKMIAAAVALVTCAACTTVESVRDEGERTEHALQQPPVDAAGCLARNIERDRGLTAAVRGAGGGAFEVVVRNGPDFVFGVADVQPAGTGSIARVWVKPGWFYRRSEFTPMMIAGC